jgi:hypothetical protein
VAPRSPHLTTWLEENVDVLNEVLDLNLTSIERERAAGSFSVDVVAEDDSGNTVAVENQLERSNHDHRHSSDAPPAGGPLSAALRAAERAISACAGRAGIIVSS